MRIDKLTIKSTEALQGAERLAREMGHAELAPVHLLASLSRAAESFMRLFSGHRHGQT
ncbi:MAG: hypothetical protein HZA51_02675 [Planctomycetes bacterium]|nr:hypothetical protein [Planctomycetota bacterium]